MGTTAQKLQKALDNKQLIVDSVNAKAGTSYDIHSKPSDIAKTIYNIEAGSGTNTNDATATANDILKGKTAYTAEGKVEGTIETYNGSMTEGAEQISTGLPLEINSTEELPQQKKSAVPNDLNTYVDNIYIDTLRSNTEVEQIIDNILGPKPSLDDSSHKSDEYGIAYIIRATSGGEIKFFSFYLCRDEFKDYFNYYIEYQTDPTNESKVRLFDYCTNGKTSDNEKVDFVGWNPNFNGKIEVNSKIGDTLYNIPFGEKNALLKDFIYVKEINGIEGTIYEIPKKFTDVFLVLGEMNGLLGAGYNVKNAFEVKTKPTENIEISDVMNNSFSIYYVLDEKDVFIYGDVGYGLMWISLSSMVEMIVGTSVPFLGELKEGELVSTSDGYGYYAYYKRDENYKISDGQLNKLNDTNIILGNFLSGNYIDKLEYMHEQQFITAGQFHFSQIRFLKIMFTSVGNYCGLSDDYAFQDTYAQNIWLTHINKEQHINLTPYAFTNNAYGFPKKLVIDVNSFIDEDEKTFALSSFTNGTGYIYVPDNKVDYVKTLNGYKQVASQIRPLSEYQEDLVYEPEQ